jgi:hypothetical protein
LKKTRNILYVSPKIRLEAKMSVNFNISQSQAINGVRFSTATPLVVPQIPVPKHQVVHKGLHSSPQDAFSFLMMMNAMARTRVNTQWGTAMAAVDDYRYSAEIPSFGKYVDDQMQLTLKPKADGDIMSIEAELDYRCCHFSIQQLAVIDDIELGAGVSTLSIRLGAELLSKAAVREDKKLRSTHPDVHRSLIRSGMCLANACMIASSMGDDCIIKKDNPVTTPRTNNAVAATTTPAFSIDEHGLYRDEEAPLFTVTYIHPEDASAPRGSPQTRAYINIVENIPFTHEGLKWAHAPFVEDIMVAAAYMRPHMFPYESVFRPRNS